MCLEQWVVRGTEWRGHWDQQTWGKEGGECFMYVCVWKEGLGTEKQDRKKKKHGKTTQENYTVIQHVFSHFTHGNTPPMLIPHPYYYIRCVGPVGGHVIWIGGL